MTQVQAVSIGEEVICKHQYPLLSVAFGGNLFQGRGVWEKCDNKIGWERAPLESG